MCILNSRSNIGIGEIMHQEDENTINPLLRKYLDDIQEMLQGDQGVALWWVLTALRGPDSPDDLAYKGRTTGRIRSAAFPGLITRDGDEMKIGSVSDYVYADAQKGLIGDYYMGASLHFKGHVLSASHVLRIHEK